MLSFFPCFLFICLPGGLLHRLLQMTYTVFQKCCQSVLLFARVFAFFKSLLQGLYGSTGNSVSLWPFGLKMKITKIVFNKYAIYQSKLGEKQIFWIYRFNRIIYNKRLRRYLCSQQSQSMGPTLTYNLSKHRFTKWGADPPGWHLATTGKAHHSKCISIVLFQFCVTQ